MLSCLSTKKYVIQSSDSGFLQLSLVKSPPALPNDSSNSTSSSSSSLSSSSSSFFNEANEDFPIEIETTWADITYRRTTRLIRQPAPTYESISTDEYFFKNLQDIFQKKLQFDVIIIPSGGMDDEGRPYTPVQGRLDAAARLNNITQYYLSSGAYTPLKPVFLNESGQPVTEARTDAVYLVERYNIIQNKLILEEMSKDTLGNAFFSRILCELMHFQTILIITSKFHMLRTRALFDWVFRLLPRFTSTLHYLETTDLGMSETEIKARELKELESLNFFWLNTKKKLTTMKDLTHFIYLGHRAYAYNNKVGCYDVSAPVEAFKFY